MKNVKIKLNNKMGDELMNIILKRINEQLSHEFIPRDMCLTTLMMS